MTRIYCTNSTQEFVLASTDVQINILNSVADVTLSQTFNNPHTTAKDCFYSFPIDPNSCVYGLEIVTPDETFHAVLKDSSIARSEYQEAVAQGKTAVLMEEKAQENLVMSIGNINPGGFVKTFVRFFTPLINEDSNLRYVLPTILFSRYTPVGYVEPPASPTASGDSAKIMSIRIDAKIESSARVSKVSCLTYDVDVKEVVEGFIFTLSLNEKEKSCKGDYVLSLILDNAHETTTAVETLEAKSAVCISFNPNFVEPEDIPDSANFDYIFVIDRSGSMSGSRISQVRDTMMLFLRSLPIGCKFNIIGFGSSFESLFTEAVIYDEINMEKASDFCKSMEADLGGTELLKPLDYIKDKVQKMGRLLNIFLLTDGSVSNTDQVLASGRSMAESTRIYTFGIGNGVSHKLVRGLAKAARGTAEFVVEGEELDSKVIRALSNASKNIMTNIVVDWGSLPFELVPGNIEYIFDGVRLTFYGLTDTQKVEAAAAKLKTKSTTILVRGKYGPRTFEFPIEVNLGIKSTLSGSIVRQAAWQRIREMEASENSGLKVAAKALSLQTSVMCSQTSFVGVSTKNPEGKPVVKIQKIEPINECKSVFGAPRMMMAKSMAPQSSMQQSRGRGGGGMRLGAYASPRMASSLSTSSSSSSDSIREKKFVSKEMKREVYSEYSMEESTLSSRSSKPGSAAGPAPPSIPSPSEKKPSPDAVLRKITELQKAAGYWVLAPEICSLIEIDVAAVKVEAQQISVPENVLVTSVVIKFIQSKLYQFKDRWVLMINKSLAWLKANTQPGSQDTLNQTTAKFV